MLLNFLLMQRKTWIIPFVLQAIAYVGALRKMGIPAWWAVVPGGADYQLTKRLYPRQRSFWRPFFVSTLLVGAAYYLNPFEGSGRTTARIFLIIAIFVYEVFLLRLYRRLSKSFGRGLPFALLTFLVPPLGLAILGYGKATYLGDPEFKVRQHGPVLTFLGRLGYVAITFVEAIAIIGVIGILTVRTKMPRPLVAMVQSTTLAGTNEVTGTGTVVTREEAMGDAAATIPSLPTSRE